MQQKITLSQLLSEIPGLTHGFTTLQSPLELVREIDARTSTAKQVHKSDLIWVSRVEKREREADAVATFEKGLSIGVYSADCTPILAAAIDVKSGQPFAIMAVHAGWRGTAQYIASKAFAAFFRVCQEKNPSFTIKASIGPCIGFDRFEVGEEVIAAFPHALSSGLAKEIAPKAGEKKFLFDLAGENARQLKQFAKEASASLALDTLGHCTLEQSDLYPSYRRDKEKAGRILSFIEYCPSRAVPIHA